MIKVYTQPNCQQCTVTYRLLDKLNLEYTVIDVSLDHDALEHIKSLGFLQAPVVETENTSWSGYRPDLIRKHLTA